MPFICKICDFFILSRKLAASAKMEGPVFKRENSIGITYVVGEIKDWHYEFIIEKILKVSESDVEGIDDRGKNRFLFEVSSKEIYERICDQFTGREIRVGSYCIVQVDDISSYGTKIEISRVPFLVTNDILKMLLQRYGEVYKCKNHYRMFGKYRQLNKTGDRIVWMRLHDHIPQTVKIKNTPIRMFVKYENQPMSCNKCGNEGHRIRTCTMKPNEFKNVINIEEIEETENINDPEIDNKEENGSPDDEHEDEKDDTDAEGPMNLSFNNLDLHIEASQDSKPFECKECDYKCKYENIFKEHIEMHKGEKSQNQDVNKHMLTHKGEKSFMCGICELISSNKSSHEKHILTHENEVLLECSECSFNCINNDVLSNHLKTHNIYACNKCEFKSTSMQGLNGHAKIHIQKTLRCTECEYTCTTMNKLNTHMRTHTEDEIQNEPLTEKAKTLDLKHQKEDFHLVQK